MTAAPMSRLPDPISTAPELRGYAVCATARSGTGFLCSLLKSSGTLGHPVEYFNAWARRLAGMLDYPDDPQLQLGKVLELGVTPNGVYGLKIFAYQAEQAKATRCAEVLPNLAFVYLERDDLLGQAISFVRAKQTNQ